MKVSVVLPTYNERENISILIPKIEEELFSINKLRGEIIVVDDKSPDGTADVASKLNKKYGNIIVIIKEKREGIGAALRVGYNAAKYDVILSSDSDLSYEIKDMKRLLDAVCAGYDLAIGSRHMVSGVYEKPNLSTFIKWQISRFGNVLVRIISGVPIHDFSANLRAIKRTAWRNIKTREKTNSILLEMIIKVYYRGYKLVEFPITFKDRVYGKSKLNLKKEAPKFFLKLLYYTWKCRILKTY